MAVNYQLAIDCADPGTLSRFWMAALGYVIEPAPEGFDTWDDYWRSVGVPEDELDGRIDFIVDPEGGGPRIQFHIVPETKSIKNRLHLDIHASGGRGLPIEERKRLVDAEAARLVGLGATIVHVHQTEGLDHYAVGLNDPEGNEFDLN